VLATFAIRPQFDGFIVLNLCLFMSCVSLAAGITGEVAATKIHFEVCVSLPLYRNAFSSHYACPKEVHILERQSGKTVAQLREGAELSGLFRTFIQNFMLERTRSLYSSP
jgi:hypothetical protein